MWKKKKIQWGVSPLREPTEPTRRRRSSRDQLNVVSALPSQLGFGASAGRWGEAEKEKGPVDLFPVEPTDEVRKDEETLNLGSRDSSALLKKRAIAFAMTLFFNYAGDGT